MHLWCQCLYSWCSLAVSGGGNRTEVVRAMLVLGRGIRPRADMPTRPPLFSGTAPARCPVCTRDIGVRTSAAKPPPFTWFGGPDGLPRGTHAGMLGRLNASLTYRNASDLSTWIMGSSCVAPKERASFEGMRVAYSALGSTQATYKATEEFIPTNPADGVSVRDLAPKPGPIAVPHLGSHAASTELQGMGASGISEVAPRSILRRNEDGTTTRIPVSGKGSSGIRG